MDTFGRHIIMDLWECNEDLLKKKAVVEKIMVDAALASKAEIREVIFHQFEPDGVSGIVIIAESHLSIHTFPEQRYASVDVYTCGGMNPDTAMICIKEGFQSRSDETLKVVRGIRPLRTEIDPYAVQNENLHNHSSQFFP